MYAIVEIAGKQIKVEDGMKIWVPYMDKYQPGEKLSFDRVLMVADGDDIKVGKPLVENASVQTTLLRHTKGPKLVVFKKIRRKGYHKKQGHRQKYSVLKIEKINI